MRLSLLILMMCLVPLAAGADDSRWEERLVEVLFHEGRECTIAKGSLTGPDAEAINDALTPFGPVEWRRYNNLPDAVLQRLHDEGERLSGKDLYDFRGMATLVLPPDHSAVEAIAVLEPLAAVRTARRIPKPVALPLPPDYRARERHLNSQADAPPTGFDALHAWTLPGGNGSNVTVCDVEYGWEEHDDLPSLQTRQLNNENPIDPFQDGNHGTASVGCFAALNNGWGTTGISYGADVRVCATYYGFGVPRWDPAGAILIAAANLQPGDVILLEQQSTLPSGQEDYVPLEWWNDVPPNQTRNAVFMAIETATANGIHVVEPAGNGSVNLDTINWLESGAIVVGAGGAYPGGSGGTGWPQGDLQTMSYSSYGSRVDVQAWGENVITTGYGDLYFSEGRRRSYTEVYAGTSSASALMAGVVAAASSRWIELTGDATTLTPLMLRDILRENGEAPFLSGGKPIGKRPDLLQVFDALEAMANPAPAGPTIALAGWWDSDVGPSGGGFASLRALPWDPGMTPPQVTYLGVPVQSMIFDGDFFVFDFPVGPGTLPSMETLIGISGDGVATEWPYLNVR